MPNPMRQKAIEGLKAGDSFTYSRIFKKEETEKFGDMTRDYNPVHYDLRWAKSKGFDRLICHGLLVGSMICEFGGQVGWLATGMSYKFIKPSYFDEKIICMVTITKIEKSGKAEAEALFFNASGEKVCCCLLTGRLPQSHERILLAQMITEGDPTNKLNNVEPENQMKYRCEWCGSDPLYVAYHDNEWGVPVHDDRRLFEKLVLEGAQAGLNWLTILRKRENYRRAFHGFDPKRIAAYSDADIQRLLQDVGIVRNHLKIESAIQNARRVLEIKQEHGSFSSFLWRYVDNVPRQNAWTSMSDLPARS